MKKRNSAHQRAQKEGRVRDCNVCQICGRIHNPEGHHIIDYQYGGGATKENIVTLCRNCHKEVHRGTLDMVRF